jgi:hypothetical protein
LSRPARAWRLVHVAWSAAQLAGLGVIWHAALTGRRGRLVRPSVGFLLLEGAGLVVGRGNCPAARFQSRCGDPVPLFELALSPRAAKLAVPVLALVSVGGLVALAARPAVPRARD